MRMLFYRIKIIKMTVYELIQKLEEFDGNEEVKLWITNLNSGSREDMETEIIDIKYEYNILFCDGEHEYPHRDGWDCVYIRLADPRFL